MKREFIIAVVGAVVAVLFDVIVSPNIAIFQASPHAVIPYVIVLAMFYHERSLYVIAFVLGMLADLLGYGPVGGLPFLLIIACMVVARAMNVFGNGTLFVSSALIGTSILAVELLHALFLLAMGTGLSALEAIGYIAVPCGLFECVLGLLMYPIMAHFLVDRRSTMGSEPPVAHVR